MNPAIFTRTKNFKGKVLISIIALSLVLIAILIIRNNCLPDEERYERVGVLYDVFSYNTNSMCASNIFFHNPLPLEKWETDFAVVCMESNACAACYRNFTPAGIQRMRQECDCGGSASCPCASITQEEIKISAHYEMLMCLCNNNNSKEEIEEYVNKYQLNGTAQSALPHHIVFLDENNLCDAEMTLAWW